MTAWTWCCLSCNANGVGEQSKPAHHCVPVEHMQNLWTKKLRFTFPSLLKEELIAIVSKPIDRTKLVEWWGWQWAAWNCSKCGDTAVIASTPFDSEKPNNGRPADSSVLCQQCVKSQTEQSA